MTASESATNDAGRRTSHDALALARVAQRWATLAAPPWLHTEVSRRMAERLELFKAKPDRIVQWWGPREGDAALRAAYPRASIVVATGADARATARTPAASRASATAHASAAQRAPASSRVPTWWQRLARRPSVQPVRDDAVDSGNAELLWANMALHAAADAPALLSRWHDALAVDGTLMFSTIGPDTLRELRQLYREMGWGPHATEPTDMHDIGDALVHAGFADPVMDQEVLTLHWADAHALLRELRELGANASNARHAGLRTPRWRERLLAGLQAIAGRDGRIGLSFEIVYGHAFKVAPRQRATPAVPLEALAATLPSRRRS